MPTRLSLKRNAPRLGTVQSRLLRPAVIVALTAVGLSSAAGTTSGEVARQVAGEGAAQRQALNAYRALRLAFVANAGQLDRRVRYSAQAGNASVFLTRRAAVVALGKGRRGLALRLAFLGANPEATIAGADRSPGRLNYLVGNDPARWQTNLPTYEEVLYRNLWPGIDMAVRGRGGQLKYEFRLDPGADPAQIRLAYGGQERLSLERSGALRIQTALGILRDSRPVSYQLVDRQRVAVASRFVPENGGAYGFALGAYDRRNPLVIDPGLVYSTYLGGTGGFESAEGIALDEAGSAYVTGVTDSTNFPTSAGAFNRSYNGGEFGDVFVTKLNPAGSALTYSTYVGGNGDDEAGGIAVDGAGSAYVTGSTKSRDFPTTAGAFDTSYGGSGLADAFVTKLNAAGSGLAFSTYLGGGWADGGSEIAVDGAGSAYVTGVTVATDFPTTAGALDRVVGAQDAFVTKLNPAGSGLAYSTYLGGRDLEVGSGIAVDGAGSAYVTGFTWSNDFPTTAGAFDTSYGGGLKTDAFVTKLNATGSDLAYSTYLGGSGTDGGGGIAADAAGSAYVTGSTASRNFPTSTGSFDRSFNGGAGWVGGDAFVTKLNAAGSRLVYSTYLGGGGREGGLGIAVDGAGGAYVTGVTASTRFPTTAGAFDRSYRGGFDPFVAKLNTRGSVLAYSTYLGGAGEDFGNGIAVDGAGSAYVTGSTGSRNFPTTTGALDRSFGGGGGWGGDDAFVTKLDLIAGPVRCHVPLVVGMTLPNARQTIRALDCSVGRIRRVRSKRAGRVLRQSPRAGTVRKRGFRVRLVVGRR
jgi:hypothetical protein